MEDTNNLKLPLLVPNQSQKEITHNEALVILDNLINNGVIDKDLTTPPSSPNQNDLYIVGIGANGEWEGKDSQLAYFDNGWKFSEPKTGTKYYVIDESAIYIFTNTYWKKFSSGSSSGGDSGGDSGGNTGGGEIIAGASALSELDDVLLTSLQDGDILKFNGSVFTNSNEINNLSGLSVNTDFDTENKFAVKSNNVLFDNNGTDSRVKVNKATENNTASHLFQNNYSGRAEFGLAGNDDFTLKVSNDGEIWQDAFVVDKATGNIDFKGEITKNGENISSGNSAGDSSLSDFIKINSIQTNNTSEIIFKDFEVNNNYIIYFSDIKGSLQNFTILAQFSSDNGLTFLNTTAYNNTIRTNHSSNINFEFIANTTFLSLTSSTDGWSIGGGNNSLFANGVLKIINPKNPNTGGKINIADFDYISSGSPQIEQSHSTGHIISNLEFNAVKIFLNKGVFSSGLITIYKQKI